MNKTKPSIMSVLLYAGAAVFLAAAGVSVFLSSNSVLLHAAIIELMVFSLLLAAALYVSIRRRLRFELYSYTNVCLVGLAVFLAFLLVALLRLHYELLGSTEESVQRVFISELYAFPRAFSIIGTLFILFISLLICVSNISLVRHEGMCPTNLLGMLLGGMFAFLTVGLLLAERYLLDSANTNLFFSYTAMFLSSFLCYFECIFIGTCIMSYIAVRHVPAYDKDFIIILGCSIDKRGGLLPLLKGRANRAVKFAWEQEIATGKSCLYVPSGGQGPNEIMSEGSAMELYLLSHGAEDNEVFPEKKSVSTWENMLFSKRIIDEMKPDARVAFSTTNYHIFRSGILAKDAGLDAEGIASDTKWYFWPNGFVREFFAILAMRKKAHITVAAIISLICTCFCSLSYFAQLM